MPNFRSLASPNWNFDRLFLLKAYKILAKKVQRNYFSWHWKGMQNLKKTWFVVSKMTNIWWILIWALKSLKNLHLYWYFLVIFDLKKYRGVIFHDTREWCKIWRNTNLWFSKWHEEFGNNFHQQTRKCQNWDPLVQSRKCMSLNWQRSYLLWQWRMVEKLKKNWLLSVQNWHEEFNKFWSEESKISNICTLLGCLWPKYIMFELKR